MNRYIIKITFLLTLLVLAANTFALDKAYLRWRNNKPIIDSIVINGNNDFSYAQIKSQMYSKTHTFWTGLKKDRRSRLNKENLSRDTLEIKYLYLSNGYLNVEIRENFLPLGVDSTCLVWVNISEGRQFFFGQTSVAGNINEKFHGDLKKKSALLKNEKPANPLLIKKVVFDMTTYMANNGYPYARVDVELDSMNDKSLLNVNFYIEPDSLVHFGNVSITGTRNYDDKIGLREVRFKPGDVYRRKVIIRSQKGLYESGYFTFAQLSPKQENENRLKPDFSLKVKERKPWFVSASTGAGQSEKRDLIWDLSFGIGKRNFNIAKPFDFDGSHRINFLADYSFSIGSNSRLVTHKYRLRYTMPWFLDLIRMPISITAEFEPSIKFEPQIFTIERRSIGLTTRKWFGEELKLNTGLEYNYIKITDIQIDDIEYIKEQEGISARRSIFANLRYDSRNNIFIPEKGAVFDLSAEYFGGFLGGDDNFYRIKSSWSTYQRLWPGWIYAIRLKGGLVREFGETESVPSEERLYLGGASSVRGFVENSIGPLLSDGSAGGANLTVVFNQEFRWKTIQFLNIIPFFKSFPQWQSIFFDVGNGFEHPEDIKAKEFAYGFGTGIQILSPAGPIRIDYARRIATERYSADYRWHFTILYAF